MSLSWGWDSATYESKLWLTLRNSAEILVLGPHLSTRIWVRAMISLLKKPLLICQSEWKEIQITFQYLVDTVAGQEQGSWRCLANVTNSGQITSVTQASRD